MKGGELRGSEHLIEGKGEARQVASRVDLVSEEFLKLAVRGRCLHDVGHFVSEQLELEVGGVKRVLLKEFAEDGVRAARVLRRNCAEMNFGLGVVPSSLNQRVYRMFEAVAVEVTVGLDCRRKTRITRKRRYGERGRGSERGSEPCVECDQSRVRGGEDREEAKGHT